MLREQATRLADLIRAEIPEMCDVRLKLTRELGAPSPGGRLLSVAVVLGAPG